jgi:hypothetical protein
MNYNLNKIPTIKRMVDEKQVEFPHIIDYSLAQLVAEKLEERMTNDNPLLEYRIAQSLRNTGRVDLNEEETAYLSDIIIQLPIDNLLKGQILEVLNPTT